MKFCKRVPCLIFFDRHLSVENLELHHHLQTKYENAFNIFLMFAIFVILKCYVFFLIYFFGPEGGGVVRGRGLGSGKLKSI